MIKCGYSLEVFYRCIAVMVSVPLIGVHHCYLGHKLFQCMCLTVWHCLSSQKCMVFSLAVNQIILTSFSHLNNFHSVIMAILTCIKTYVKCTALMGNEWLLSTAQRHTYNCDDKNNASMGTLQKHINLVTSYRSVMYPTTATKDSFYSEYSYITHMPN